MTLTICLFWIIIILSIFLWVNSELCIYATIIKKIRMKLTMKLLWLLCCHFSVNGISFQNTENFNSYFSIDFEERMWTSVWRGFISFLFSNIKLLWVFVLPMHYWDQICKFTFSSYHLQTDIFLYSGLTRWSFVGNTQAHTGNLFVSVLCCYTKYILIYTDGWGS